MIAEIADTVEAVTVATDNGQTTLHSHSNRAELSRVSCQHVEFSLVTSPSTTITDFAFDCSSGVAKPCDLVLVHPHPPLCAGAYFWICITDVSSVTLDDGVSLTVYNPRRIQLRAQRGTTRKRIHCLDLMNTAVAPAGAHAYLLGQQLEEPATHLHRLRRECYFIFPLFFLF
jgi:hypothetical protein